MQYFLILKCSWLCRSRMFLKKFKSPPTGLRGTAAVRALHMVLWWGLQRMLSEMCSLESAQGQKQNKGAYPGWCCLTSLSNSKGLHKSVTQDWYQVWANRLYWEEGSACWSLTLQLLKKELVCIMPMSSLGTANARLPALEYRFTSQADKKPKVECLILSEFSFSPYPLSNLPISITLHLLTPISHTASGPAAPFSWVEKALAPILQPSSRSALWHPPALLSPHPWGNTHSDPAAMSE